VHYGWVILLVGTLGLMMTTPGQTIGVSVFLDPIIDDLGATRAGVSLLYTLGTLAGALALPFVGRAIDRRGPRLAVGWIAGAFAAACVYMATVTSLPALALGFVLLRGLGQGALGLVSLHVINVWFVRRRGLAVGVTGVGIAIATAGFPWLIEAWVAGFGWRTAYALLGGLVALTILPLGIAFFRSQPERFGLLPDGGRPRPGPATVEPRFTLAEARRSPAFWLLTAGVTCISALSTALVFHHYDLMATVGIDRAAATTTFAWFAWVIAVTHLGVGALSDRLDPRVPLVAMLLLQALALVAAGRVTAGSLPVYGALLGMTMGVAGNVSGTVFARFFGRAALGGIKGTAQTVSVAGTAAGPLLLAWSAEGLGGYLPALSALLPIPLLLAVACGLALRPPRPPVHGP